MKRPALVVAALTTVALLLTPSPSRAGAPVVFGATVRAVPHGLTSLTPSQRRLLAPALAAEPALLSRLTCGVHDLLLPDLPGACSHGDDEAPVSTSAPGSSGTAGPSLALHCSTDQGNRLQPVYAHLKGKDHLSTYRTSVQRALEQANAVVARSAHQSGGSRQLRVLTTSSGGHCQALITDATVSTKALNDLPQLLHELQAQGLQRSDRKYVVFGDGTTALCGIGSLYQDDRSTPINLNNLGGSMALLARAHGCWNGTTVAHEVLHMLGGVQLTAPHATGGYHCNDGADVMCYDDRSGHSHQRSVCPTAAADLLDCGKDDYFSTSAPSGSYLAHHWNAASSSFLYGGGPPAPLPPGAIPDLSADVTDDAETGQRSVHLAWQGAPGRVTGYRLTQPDGRTVTLSASARSMTQNVPADEDQTWSLAAQNEAGPGPSSTASVTARPRPDAAGLPWTSWPP